MGDMANHPTPMAAAANEVQLFSSIYLFFRVLSIFAFCVLVLCIYLFVLECCYFVLKWFTIKEVLQI